MGLTFYNRIPKGKRCSPVIGPSLLKNARRTAHSFYPKAVSESFAGPNVLDERFDCLEKLDLLFARLVVKVEAEACQP